MKILNDYSVFNTDTIKGQIFKDREAWLQGRTNTVGGSDASCIVGLNPYKTNQALWNEKANGIPPKDISEKEYVKYGTDAEQYLRELFALDYPNYQVYYAENNMFRNSELPYAHYSADGWLQDLKTGEYGLLEIKTTNILQSIQKEKWKDRIPDNYYIQCLHGMLVTGAKFVCLKAQLKSEFKGEPYLQTKHYLLKRDEMTDDLEYLKGEELKFFESLKNGKEPALILPDL